MLVCLPLAAPIGLSPLYIPTLCGSERVVVVSTEPLDDFSCLTTPGLAVPETGCRPCRGPGASRCTLRVSKGRGGGAGATLYERLPHAVSAAGPAAGSASWRHSVAHSGAERPRGERGVGSPDGAHHQQTPRASTGRNCRPEPGDEVAQQILLLPKLSGTGGMGHVLAEHP